MAVSRPGSKPAPIFSGCSAHHTGQQREETPDAAHRGGVAQVRPQSGMTVKTQAA